jgi:hypothetical protein
MNVGVKIEEAEVATIASRPVSRVVRHYTVRDSDRLTLTNEAVVATYVDRDHRMIVGDAVDKRDRGRCTRGCGV